MYPPMRLLSRTSADPLSVGSLFSSVRFSFLPNGGSGDSWGDTDAALVGRNNRMGKQPQVRERLRVETCP